MAYRARANDPAPHPFEGQPRPANPKRERFRGTKQRDPRPERRKKQPTAADLLVQELVPEEGKAKISMINTIMGQMKQNGVKVFDLSPEFIEAMPRAAAKLILRNNSRAISAGIRSGIAMARINLAVFSEANKTDPVKVEQTVTGDTYNITITPPPGASGELPYPIARAKKVDNTAKAKESKR